MPPSTVVVDSPVLFDPGAAVTEWSAVRPLPPLAEPSFGEGWTWQILPDGLMYRSYLAGGRESRFASHWAGTNDGDSVWDITLGGRVGVLRYGTDDPLWPEGWQIGLEGAAFPRLTLDTQRDLVAVDFRVGVPLTFHQGPWETKFAYYHLSSHLGDEFILKNPQVARLNYARDAFVFGLGWRPHADWRLYGEVGYAFYIAGGAAPWEFQFGAEFSPMQPTTFRGAPFVAVNSRLREEVNYSGNLTAQAGWQWRGTSGHLFRMGYLYFNGKSDQFQFHREHEQLHAVGLWYDY